MLPVAKSIFLFPISTTFIIFNNIILCDELQYIFLTFYINIALMPKRMTYIFSEFGFPGKRKRPEARTTGLFRHVSYIFFLFSLKVYEPPSLQGKRLMY